MRVLQIPKSISTVRSNIDCEPLILSVSVTFLITVAQVPDGNKGAKSHFGLTPWKISFTMAGDAVFSLTVGVYGSLLLVSNQETESSGLK